MPDNVQSRARLHEKAVQKVAKEGVKKTRGGRRGGSGSRSGRVTTTRWSDNVDGRIVHWVESRKIHHSRIQVISPTEIIVWNPGAPHNRTDRKSVV